MAAPTGVSRPATNSSSRIGPFAAWDMPMSLVSAPGGALPTPRRVVSAPGGALPTPRSALLPRGHAHVGKREAHDLTERRRGHRTAVDRPGLRFVHDHRAKKLGVGRRGKADERSDEGRL